MNFYQTRDLIAVGRPLAYDGQEHQPGARFRPMSQVDSDYLVSRGRAQVAPDDAPPPAAPVAAPAPPIADTSPPAADQVAESPQPEDAEASEEAAPTRRRGRPPNARRAPAAD